MPKVVPDYKVQARDRIVAAAHTAFARRGFRSTTMDDIAREVGVSKGTLYLYFPTKIHLLKEIQNRGRAEAFAKLEHLIGEGDVATGFARVVEELVAEHDSTIWHDLLVQAGGDPELRGALESDRRNDLTALRRFLRSLVAAGRLPADTDVDAIAPIMTTLLEGGAVRLMLGEKSGLVRRELVQSLRYVLDARAAGKGA